MQQPTPSKQTAIKTLFKAFEILKQNNNELAGREVINQIEKDLELTEWEKERYEKTGYIRWQSILHFYTIDAIKAGYMVKKKGIWFLTDEGPYILVVIATLNKILVCSSW